MPIVIKTVEQIDGIRKSCQLAARTLQFIEPKIIPGVTTEYLNQECETFIRDHGAIPAPLNYKGFPKATCTSVNEVVCHGIPSERVLKEGDILNIDVTTILDGYFGDTCKTFPVGCIGHRQFKLLKISEECLYKGINQVSPGNPLGNIGYAISKHAYANKYSVVYEFVGHGVGLEFHEEPHICHNVNKRGIGQPMKPGMIFTVEPMINEKAPKTTILNDGWTAVTVDGGLSAQFEHTILVTEKSHEILTKLYEPPQTECLSKTEESAPSPAPSDVQIH